MRVEDSRPALDAGMMVSLSGSEWHIDGRVQD